MSIVVSGQDATMVGAKSRFKLIRMSKTSFFTIPMAAFGYSRALAIALTLLTLHILSPHASPAMDSPVNRTSSAKKNAIDLSSVEAELRHFNISYTLKTGKQSVLPPLSDSALALLEKALTETPGDPQAHLLLARYYERMSMTGSAIEEYKKTVACLADAQAVAALAIQQLKIGNVWYAGRVLDAGIKRFPENVDLLALCADSLAARGRVSEAMALYQTVLQRQPMRLGVRSVLAQMLLASGNYQEAAKLADWDLKREPQSTVALSVLGDAYVRLNQYEKAVPLIQLAFVRSPLQPGVAHEYAFLLYWKGDYQAALSPALIYICLHPEECQQPGSVWPVNPTYAAGLKSLNVTQWKGPGSAWIVNLLRKVRPDYLTKTIANVSSLMHANATFHFALGELLDQANLRHLAIQQYGEGLATVPYDAQALFRLGKDLELDDKNYAKALSLYQEAHAKAPYNLEITEYLSRFESRLKLRRTDLGWRLRDWITNCAWQPQNK
jgi:tetratricopeptide (TPR) repeat protein